MMKDEPASVFLLKKKNGVDETARVVFDEPQWAPASGQSAVIYHDDTVIGGGIINISA